LRLSCGGFDPVKDGPHLMNPDSDAVGWAPFRKLELNPRSLKPCPLAIRAPPSAGQEAASMSVRSTQGCFLPSLSANRLSVVCASSLHQLERTCSSSASKSCSNRCAKSARAARRVAVMADGGSASKLLHHSIARSTTPLPGTNSSMKPICLASCGEISRPPVARRSAWRGPT
jgi:hypothetical protein